MSLSFCKMNGLGNDFVVLDLREHPLALRADQVAAIADRTHGVGCDQLIALEPSTRADVFMRIWNADGGEVGACGNAARCVAALLAEESGSPQVSIATESAVLAATANDDGSVTVDMGAPRLNWDEIPLAKPVADTKEIAFGPQDDPALNAPGVVNMGNPHCIFFVEDVDAHDLARLGPVLEHDPLFPERANISLAQVAGPAQLAGSHLGAGRRADTRLRHRSLCRSGRCGQAWPHQAQGHGEASGWRPRDRVARGRRPCADDRALGARLRGLAAPGAVAAGADG